MPLGFIMSAPEARKQELAALSEEALDQEVERMRGPGIASGDAVDLMKAFMDFQSYTLEREPLENMFMGEDMVGLVNGGEVVVQWNSPEKTAELDTLLKASPATLFNDMRLSVDNEMREKAISRQQDYPEFAPQGFLDRLLGRPKKALPVVVPDIREQAHDWEIELFGACKALYARAAESGNGMLTVVMV